MHQASDITGWVTAATPWLTALAGLAILTLGLGSKTVGAWMDARRATAAATRRYQTDLDDARVADLTQDVTHLKKRVGQLTDEQDEAWWLAHEHARWDNYIINRLARVDPNGTIPNPPPLLPRSQRWAQPPSATTDQEE